MTKKPILAIHMFLAPEVYAAALKATLAWELTTSIPLDVPVNRYSLTAYLTERLLPRLERSPVTISLSTAFKESVNRNDICVAMYGSYHTTRPRGDIHAIQCHGWTTHRYIMQQPSLKQIRSPLMPGLLVVAAAVWTRMW